MRVLLDTSCLVSFFLKDKYTEKAKSALEKILRNEIQGIISALSLVELCGVIRRNLDEQTAKEVKSKIDRLIEKGLLDIIPIKILDANSASNLAIATGLKGADAVILNAAKENNAKLLTFDEEIKEKGKSFVDFFPA